VIKEFDASLTCQGYEVTWTPNTEQSFLRHFGIADDYWIARNRFQNKIGSTTLAVGML
jgi:hypothetical protein